MSKINHAPATYVQPDVLDESGVPLYGLDKELAAKRAAKFSPEREKQAREWIELLIGERFDESLTFQENLKDGTKLCRLINAIMPGAIPKVQSSNMPFRQMENINHFLTAIEKWGVPKFELFMTVDLYENKNIMQVIDCMFAVSRTAAKLGYQGPILGPKLAESRTINFTPEQLAEAKNTVSLQYGYAGGANQSGITFGGVRTIGGIYPDKPPEEGETAEQPAVGQPLPAAPAPAAAPIAAEPAASDFQFAPPPSSVPVYQMNNQQTEEAGDYDVEDEEDEGEGANLEGADWSTIMAMTTNQN